MASNERTFTAEIKVNAQEAQNRLQELKKDVDDLRKKQKDALNENTAEGKKRAQQLQKEIDLKNKLYKQEEKHVKGLNSALQNLSDKTYKELQQEVRALNKLMRDGTVEKGSMEWKALAERVKQCKREMREYQVAVEDQKGGWSRFTKFLNDSWGGLTLLISSMAGLSMTIRKVTSDYADMEQEMANVRKYTGQSMEEVERMNEDFKNMDTRTARTELNQLAGAAGRLGITSTDAVEEFVDAADKIGVALGDDLGDGAVDKIGKLAMAFGEDDKMGLRGAMLATGSAINELAQNSSANAGYLVDFTARVAGFGKQLGLTQAQIMGYGAVMDENLLQDEMSATAFGNMLTKMQTDTAKFARIAGMDVMAFTDLLRKDANGAVLALADSLKKADPTTMMKMLNDMGLDGSRAVGVLSTMADKIDDVRERQRIATEAYKEGTSVIKEFEIQNNTVQAGIEKAKKQFLDLSIELGEKLLPVVKYTITGTSMLVKSLNVITEFLKENWKAVVALTGAIVLQQLAWNASTIAMKVFNVVETITISLQKGHAIVVNMLRQAYVAWRIVIAAVTANQVRLNSAMVDMKRLQMTNIWGALATVILTAAVAIYGAVSAWQKHREAVKANLQEVKNLRAQQKLQQDIAKSVAESTVKEKTRIEQLSRIIHSNAYTVDERRKAIKTLQDIVPNYHASISKEGEIYNENSKAIKDYIQDLNDAAMAEAIYTKKVEINTKKLDIERRKERIHGSLKAVQAYRDANQEAMAPKSKALAGSYSTSIEIESDAMTESKRQEKIHRQRLAQVESEEKVVKAEDKFLDAQLEKNKKLNKYYTDVVSSKTADSGKIINSTGKAAPYTSPEEIKKKMTEQEKAENARLKALKDADAKEKAETDRRLAENILGYQAGEQNYLEYLGNMKKIQEEGLQARMNVWGKETAEHARYQKQLAALQLNGDNERKRMKLSALEREHELIKAKMEISFNDEHSQYYQNEAALNEAIFQEDISFLQKKATLYREGSMERMEVEMQLDDLLARHKMEKEAYFQSLLADYKERWQMTSMSKRETLEINALDELHKLGLIKEEEYQKALAFIRSQYAPDKSLESRGAKALDTAKKNAGTKDRDAGNDMVTGIAAIGGAIANQKLINDKLKEMYGEDYENNKEYQEAKRQLNMETMDSIVTGAQAAYSTISQFMSAASGYAQACSDLEVAKITKNYDKQIEAAGNNQKQRERLEKEKEKAIAKAKDNANKKAMKIEIAQAIASTAMAAINAYSSAAAIPVIGYILAPIAAAMATAAGALQIATIKKQHEAEAAGYYEGGFTGGKRYKKKAGVVHEGEFVANHHAVNNPELAPLFNLLDQAQRNNTVGSLTAEDVSRKLGSDGKEINTVVNFHYEELRGTLDRMSSTVDGLTEMMAELKAEGIPAIAAIDGPNGVKHQLDVFNKLISK